MEERKPLEISISTFFLLLSIIVIIVMAFYMYTEKTNSNREISNLESNAAVMQNKIDELQGKIDSISNTNSSSSTVNDNIDKTTKIYNECKKQCEGVIYRRETGGSSAFFIKNGILYSGEEDIVETQAKTSGITGSVKYVVPLNKQNNKTIALTQDGKLYINKAEGGLYGNSFEKLLNNYEILEIIELPNEEEFKFLSSDGKIINMDGTVYLKLL